MSANTPQAVAHLLALKVDQREREWASVSITEGTEHYIVSVIGSEIVHWANLSPRKVSGFLAVSCIALGHDLEDVTYLRFRDTQKVVCINVVCHFLPK